MNQFEEWANPIIKEYQDILLLQDHLVSINLNDRFEFEEGYTSADFFECTIIYPYKEISIKYGKRVLNFYTEGQLDSLKQAILHELIHCLTEPLYSVGVDRYATADWLNSERERLTDHIANVLHKIIK